MVIQRYQKLSKSDWSFVISSIRNRSNTVIGFESTRKPNRNHTDRLIIKLAGKGEKRRLIMMANQQKQEDQATFPFPQVSLLFSLWIYMNSCPDCSFCSADLGFGLRNLFVLYCWTRICGNHREEQEDLRKKKMKTGSSTLDLTSPGLPFRSPRGFVSCYLCDSLCISVFSLYEISI